MRQGRPSTAAIDGPAGPSMATKSAMDGPAGPVVAGDHLRRDRTLASFMVIRKTFILIDDLGAKFTHRKNFQLYTYMVKSK